jgi:hypothetical protein
MADLKTNMVLYAYKQYPYYLAVRPQLKYHLGKKEIANLSKLSMNEVTTTLPLCSVHKISSGFVGTSLKGFPPLVNSTS